jgi:hypothetical protein
MMTKSLDTIRVTKQCLSGDTILPVPRQESQITAQESQITAVQRRRKPAS